MSTGKEERDNPKSRSTKGSSRSSSAATFKRAKAEATRIKLEYARKEKELKKIAAELLEKSKIDRIKSELEAELQLLSEEKEAAAAEAEATVLEALDLPENKSQRSNEVLLRTRNFVMNLPDPISQNQHSDETEHFEQPELERRGSHVQQNQLGQHSREIHADVISPTSHYDFGRFLLKKDLLLSRLMNFNENPETFHSWRSSFQSVMKDLAVSPEEELDLLVKYLGPESSRYAQSIRTSNHDSPQRGLTLLWHRLEDRFGSPELIESCLRKRLDQFPAISLKESRRLYDLCDILDEIQSAKCNPKIAPLLSVYDSSVGANTIIGKLPHPLRQKWITQAAKYKEEHLVAFPPFLFVVEFMRKISKVQNDPAFSFESEINKQYHKQEKKINTRLTSVDSVKCPIHKARHSLAICKTFAAKTMKDRQSYLKENHICFKCLSPGHRANECKVDVKCEKCERKHCTVMHRDPGSETVAQAITSQPFTIPSSSPSLSAKPHTSYGGEGQNHALSKCTAVCGTFTGRSCGKVVKVQVYKEGKMKDSVSVYAVIDDQSNSTLASPDLLDQLNVDSEEFPYLLTSCSGTQSTSGRRAYGLCVQSIGEKKVLRLPPVLECKAIPNDRSEIPTPEVALHHKHLVKIAKCIPQIDDVPIGLLIGRDMPEAHHVLEQVIGPPGSPFAQRLHLGWVIVGDVCLNRMHPPSIVHASKTAIIHGERGTIFEPCTNDLKITEIELLGDGVFQKTKDDEKPGMSVDDRKFLAIMEKQFQKNEDGHWSAPLPLRSDSPIPTCNRSQAISRAHILDLSLKRDSVKREHFFKFMSKILDSGSAEVAPPLERKEGQCWYLPFFGVYHPKKPDQVRGVFDSSATFQGISLNSMMYSGPDLTNSLLGILLRFRRDAYAIAADVEQMFYQFFVHPKHRDLLRFFWYENNDFTKPLIEYRMCVHVFGNSPSPAVATYGLRLTVANSADDVKDFVGRDFYVDDGVTSVPEKNQAVDLMSRTQMDLMNAHIRLHKIVSNDRDILGAFPLHELAPELQNVNFSDPTVPLPVHNCLGLPWNLESDAFVIGSQLGKAPFTRRGLLSVLNGIYDPVGFLGPVVIAGKIIFRQICPDGRTWDEPIPTAFQQEWDHWKDQVESLNRLEIPRMYVPVSLTQCPNVKFHIFCDASEKAISSVAYVEASNQTEVHFGFVMGKAKVAPSVGHTIPRLELCSAVLATELWQLIVNQLDVDPKSVTFYSDSKVVLGYISNETRRFYTYVSNRVECIRRISEPEQWRYVPTSINPADAATRHSTDGFEDKLQTWLHGPQQFLQEVSSTNSMDSFLLITPENDKEIRPSVLKTDVSTSPQTRKLISRVQKFSSWSVLTKSICLLKHICTSFQSPTNSCKGWHYCTTYYNKESQKSAKEFILKAVQSEAFVTEIMCLNQRKNLPKSSSIISLSPFLDGQGILRVGGRLSKAKESLGYSVVHPVIIPKNHHVGNLLVRHFHEQVRHQGRHFTEGALRSAGYWIIGAKRLVMSMIRQCFICKMLRGKPAEQQMANLPGDRVLPSAPFSHVGVDVFGPWSVLARKTRGGLANSKRWAVIFTCMSTRAIHIEVIEELSSSSFINALIRFTALRGPVQELRSDRGTNFIGAASDLDMQTLFIENGPVQKHLSKSGVSWKFNPPHSSHMGGSWERMIGIIRKILNAMLLDMRRKPLTHEVLCTLMAEVCAIVNSRPIVSISHDPDSPLVITPSMLLTMKCGQEYVPFHPDIDLKELYKCQWKHVQVLSNTFWKHWKEEYLQSLQRRRKWENKIPNLREGDLVLLRDPAMHRGQWPIGVVNRAFPSSDDSLVRSVEVRVIKDQEPVNYIRPITELIPL